ncbi:MAG: hypothetical protein IKM66_08825 [Clostridia bacterium]|nr:hypothetical protein [Clostridia bacterium]
MIEKKLDTLFSELTEEEVNTINKSQINTDCELDPKIISRISEKVQAKTGVDYTYNSDKKAKKFVGGKKLRNALIAAVIVLLFAVSAGAAYQFMLPDGLNEQLELHEMNIKTVVDIDKADENSVRTVQKTVNKNGYTVNFEAIVDGYVILPDIVKALRGLDTSEEIREDRIYAVMTITRDDGKSVMAPDGHMPGCFCCDAVFAFDFTVAVKGFAPNSVMFTGTPWHYEENNVLYYLCDITDTAKFADRDLSIILYGEKEGTYGTIVRMDEKGEYYFVDTYDGMGAIFDFDLDDSLADPEAVAKDIAERPYVYVTDPDYTLADEMIAKDEAVKKMDLSYAIGNHRWYGWDPLQFGDVPYAETFIELFKNKSELEKTDPDTFRQMTEEASAVFEEAYLAEIERIAGKPLDELTDDELNNLAYETEEARAELEKVKADFLREKLDFIKLEDGSEYCYIDGFAFLYIPAGSEYAQVVIVYGDRIVISLDCTEHCLINIFINRMDENAIPADMYLYWYLFGVDEDSRYAKLYNEEDFKLHSQNLNSEQDAIFSLLTEFKYFDGTVEVIRK